MKPLIGKKCKKKGCLVWEALTPNVGGTPKDLIPSSFKIGESNLKEGERGSSVTSAFATTLDLIEALRGNVIVAVNLGT